MATRDMWMRIIDQQELNAETHTLSACNGSRLAELHVIVDELKARSLRVRLDAAAARAELAVVVARARLRCAALELPNRR
jgi:hypothetical protein